MPKKQKNIRDRLQETSLSSLREASGSLGAVKNKSSRVTNNQVLRKNSVDKLPPNISHGRLPLDVR